MKTSTIMLTTILLGAAAWTWWTCVIYNTLFREHLTEQSVVVENDSVVDRGIAYVVFTGPADTHYFIGGTAYEQMQKEAQESVLWAVYGPDGKVRVESLADSEAMSIHRIERGSPWRWQSMQLKGYLCKQVEVTIKPKP